MNITTRSATVVLVAVLLPLAGAGAAQAATPRGPETAASATAPYAERLDALGGRTLAQYVADHQAGDRRLR